MTTVALFGASGRTGTRVLSRLLARGDRVQALVRDPARLAPHPRLVVGAGDARDTAAVTATLAGSEAVVVALGLADISQPTTAFSDAVRTIVAAMREGGPRRILAIASAGALPDARGGLRSDHAPPGPFTHIGAEHARNWRTLADSGLAWTLICPVDLVDLPEGRARTAYEALPAGGSQTGYEDLATAMVALLDDRGSHGRRVGIVSAA